MKRSFFALFGLIALLMSCTDKKPTTEEMVEVTDWPIAIFAGDYPDPSILADGDDYYMTYTTNYWLPALPIWHSKDLVNWEPIGHALEKYLGTVWAPDFQKVDGRYYIYFPADAKIYVVWADDVRGPWSEPIDLGIQAIDPGLIVDENGERFLYLNGGNMVKLAPDGLSTVGEVKHTYDAWPIPEDWVVECECLESPKLLKHDGWYYIISAQGGTAGPATSHMAVACRSRQADGPWEQSPYNPIVHTWSDAETWWSKGHGTLFADKEGAWWMVYHAYRKNYQTLGRHILLEPMKWTEDGWPVSDAESPRKLATKKEGTETELQWLSWKGDTNMQTAVVGDTCYTMTGHVTLPDSTGEAGLLLSYDEKAFTGIMADASTLHLWHEGKAVGEIANPSGKELWLRIVNQENQVTLFAGKSDHEMEQVGETYDVSQMQHNKLGSFMSLRPAWKRTASSCKVDQITVTK